MDDAVSLEDYTNYLCSLFGFVKVFETSVYPLLAEQMKDMNLRRKTALLVTDLKNLNEPIEHIPLMPGNLFNNYYTDAYEAWGAMYVMEGSTLGGQIISRHIKKQLPGAVQESMHYMKAYNEQTSTMWKGFIQQFSAIAIESGQEKKIIESAIKTFELLDNWMSGKIM